MQPRTPLASRRGAARRGRRFALSVAGALIALALLLALLMRFEFVSSDCHAPFAMALGVIFTALLGAGLMGLSFYSSRAGFDDAVRGMDENPAGRGEAPADARFPVEDQGSAPS